MIFGRYAHQDRAMRQTSFPSGVEDLAMNLYAILRDTSQIKRYEEDPVMMIDLQCRIAEGYRNSPDLRLTWLQVCCRTHQRKGKEKTREELCNGKQLAFTSFPSSSASLLLLCLK